MIGFERDENLAIGRTNRGVITKGEIDALRYADVVQYQCQIRWLNELADGFFHIRKDLLALFKPRSGRCVDVQTKLARINSLEKMPSDDRQNRERAANENKKQDENAQSVLQGPGQSIDVTLTKFFESSIKRFLNPGEKIGRRFFAFVTANEIFHHYRHERARKEIRREHGEDDGEREGGEEIFRRAG